MKTQYDIKVIKGDGGWDEASWFVTECINLPGCFSMGKTKEEAMLNIEDAVLGYKKCIKKHNDSYLPILQKKRTLSTILRMMIISSTEVVRVFNKVGYVTEFQTDKHVFLRSESAPFMKLSVFRTSKLSPVLLNRLLVSTGLGDDQFVEILKSCG